MTELDRSVMLADLADAINELTQKRHHVELIETEQREGTKRHRVVRRKRVKTFPSLLAELATAMRPAASGDASAAGFESRPAAELEPITVMKLITEQSTTWAKALGVFQRGTLVGLLHGLVGAHHTDRQLANLLHDAEYWVRRARLATGWDTSPITLNQPCPYCWRKHALVITDNLERARCTKCGREWDELTIGLLGQMLTANAEVETMPMARCDSLYAERRCYRPVEHEAEHRDELGRYWYDMEVAG